MSHKYVYLFTEGNGSMRELLGGKGANLAEMTNIGLPVPQGFTVSTEACTKYYEDGRMINEDIQSQIMEHVAKLEQITGKINVSLRSVDAFPCNEVAAEFFNGGGHLNASGGELHCTMDEAVALFKKAIHKYKTALTE